jgi:hypothetical protein
MLVLFPAVSVAHNVNQFVPGDSGTLAVQDVVPLAMPVRPSNLSHETDAMPLSSAAVPRIVMTGALDGLGGAEVRVMAGGRSGPSSSTISIVAVESRLACVPNSGLLEVSVTVSAGSSAVSSCGRGRAKNSSRTPRRKMTSVEVAV